MRIMALLIAAIGMLMIPSFRCSPKTEDDEDSGLFIGSARPLPAKPQNGSKARSVSPVSRRRNAEADR